MFPIHCPDLIPDFYDLSLNKFLLKQKTFLGKMYNEVNQTKNYIESQIKRKVKFTETTEQNVYDSYIDFLKIKQTEIETETSDLSNKNKPKDITTQKWFKTGIALATSEAFQVYHTIGANRPTEICRKTGVHESNKTYISATINDSSDNDKNIFNSVKKLKALHKHLTNNNLPFGTNFLKKYNEIEPD